MPMLPEEEARGALEEPLLSGDANPETNVEIPSDNDSEGTSSIVNKDIVLPKCWGEGRSVRVNHNVFLNLVLAVLYGISGSLWNGTAYAAYLKKLGHDRNGPFGDIEAVYGLATLVTALPVGYLADRLGRSKVIAGGGVLLLFAAVFQTGIMEWVGVSPDHHRTDIALWLFALINVAWGIGDGVVNGPCSALYADSTPEGERSVYYNYLFACYAGASAVGPLVSIILFQTLGDDWSIYDLRIVIYVGLAIEIFNSFLMMLFDDNKALDEDPENDDEEEENDEGDGTLNENNAPEAARDETSSNPENVEHELTPLQRRQQWIPYIIFAQDLVTALGSGMTIKFFPLFFKDEIGMTPSQVQVIFCVAPLAMVIASTIGSKLARSGFGRVQTQLLFLVLGVGCLYFMVFFKSSLDAHPMMLVPIYVLRTCFMNGTYPLQESILMDFVPKEVRARWKSLDSVAAFGWCGSAAFGGWLADRYDYTYSFLITAILQSIAIGIWALLLPLVPREEGSSIASDTETTRADISPASTAGSQTVENHDVSPDGTLRQPLISE